MDYAIRIGWFRQLLALMRAAHARDSREWIRRMEAPAGRDPGRRS
jgi:hypothetical protein